MELTENDNLCLHDWAWQEDVQRFFEVFVLWYQSSGNFQENCVMIGRVGVTCISANVFFCHPKQFFWFPRIRSVHVSRGENWNTASSSGSSGRVRGGRETWNLCGRLRRPSFLWPIFTGPGGAMAPSAPPWIRYWPVAMAPHLCCHPSNWNIHHFPKILTAYDICVWIKWTKQKW